MLLTITLGQLSKIESALDKQREDQSLLVQRGRQIPEGDGNLTEHVQVLSSNSLVGSASSHLRVSGEERNQRAQGSLLLGEQQDCRINVLVSMKKKEERVYLKLYTAKKLFTVGNNRNGWEDTRFAEISN